ncbi:MAG: transketolase [bacterium]
MPIGADKLLELKKICREFRIEDIKILTEAGSGHPGGSLSAVEIVTTLYFHKMRHDPKRPDWPERDRFVISKGHAVPILYIALAKAGYFPKEQLMTLRKLESPLQGHPDRVRCPGIEASTGALGQGLSVAQGMALASKLSGNKFRVYCMIGDGESQEGQIWEAAMSAPKFKLDNLTVFLDYNKGQIDGHVYEVMPIEPVRSKWEAFGWNVLDINGHDLNQISDALDAAEKSKGKPTLIIAQTIKGKGVSFMEDQVKWHGATPSKEQAAEAIAELQAAPL